MHLPLGSVDGAFANARGILRPGGVLIADIASAFRRRLHGVRAAGWHGGTALEFFEDLAALALPHGLRRRAVEGIMLAPVHRLPERWRALAGAIDRRLAGAAPDACSYIVGVFVREPAQ